MAVPKSACLFLGSTVIAMDNSMMVRVKKEPDNRGVKRGPLDDMYVTGKTTGEIERITKGDRLVDKSAVPNNFLLTEIERAKEYYKLTVKAMLGDKEVSATVKPAQSKANAPLAYDIAIQGYETFQLDIYKPVGQNKVIAVGINFDCDFHFMIWDRNILGDTSQLEGIVFKK